ncbi:hypothetical protein Tco_1210427 [Tanacetum coccineum]
MVNPKNEETIEEIIRNYYDHEDGETTSRFEVLLEKKQKMRKTQRERERKFEDNRFATTEGITQRIDYSLIRLKNQRCRVLYKVEDIATCLVEYVKFWDDWEVGRYRNANLGRYGISVSALTKDRRPQDPIRHIQERQYAVFKLYGNKIFWKISNVVPTPRKPQYAVSKTLDTPNTLREPRHLGIFEVQSFNFGRRLLQSSFNEARFEIIAKEDKEHIVEKKIDVILPLQDEFASPKAKGSLNANEYSGVEEVVGGGEALRSGEGDDLGDAATDGGDDAVESGDTNHYITSFGCVIPSFAV